MMDNTQVSSKRKQKKQEVKRKVTLVPVMIIIHVGGISDGRMSMSPVNICIVQFNNLFECVVK